MNYIHNNPVKAELVGRPEDYLFGSVRDYVKEKRLVQIVMVLADRRSAAQQCCMQISFSFFFNLDADPEEQGQHSWFKISNWLQVSPYFYLQRDCFCLVFLFLWY